MAAVREALLNAIIHRDYSFNGSTIVNIYDDRIEFLSLGGLVPGLSMEAVMMGVSQSRNAGLANIFFRLKLVESYGTGIKRINALYKGSHKQAIFESATGAFRTPLFNLERKFCNQWISDFERVVLNAYIRHRIPNHRQAGFTIPVCAQSPLGSK